ncbi:DUF5131 family protein [uncultured Brachyspira sp.]|uniref:DUF5131 family protein n=1 Tax=uncultured Brachyspira sp. TaxID=221953 RepID=UPI0025FD04C6|nr:phage Gp37/Gp68 family protein [uncultured Brachyspira sp.]
MANNSNIEWTESTWNPVTGCTKVSAGCQNCYAEKLANRLYAMGVKNYINKFELTIHKEALNIPMKWRKPRMIFVNSMSDLFHEDIPLEFLKRIFNVMNECSQHTFQILTKRSENMLKLSSKLKLTDNIWLGVTVENNASLYRISDLLKTNSKIKFVSFEPLLTSLPDLDTNGLDWAIVGGESGYNARPMKEEWVIDIKNRCLNSNTAFFFKQWGGANKKKNGRLLQGRTWNAMPEYALSI